MQPWSVCRLTITTIIAVVLLAACSPSSPSGAPPGPSPTDEAHLRSTLPPLTVSEPAPHRPRYSRDDWLPSGWDDADGDGCNTRKEVLIAESSTPVNIGERCALRGGTWYDAFSGVRTDDPSRLQIDHLVALADADRSGGWAWPATRKRAFANNLDDPDELNAIDGKLNQDKGDLGPEGWTPPHKEARCRYIAAYVRIKSQWGLTVTPEQWGSIARAWRSCPAS